MAALQFTIICLLFGSNFKLMALARQGYGPAEVGLGRVVGAALFVGLLWLLSRPRAEVPWSKLWDIFLFGIAANGYPYVVQPFLLGSAFPHSYLAMTVTFTPLLTILLSIPMLGEWPHPRKLIGVLGGLAAISLILIDGGARGLPLLLLALAITVPASYAWGNTYMRGNLQGVASLPLTTLMLLFCALSLLPIVVSPSLAESLHVAPPATRGDLFWPTMALLGLGPLGTGLTMWLFVRLVQSHGPLFAGMVTYVVPLIALCWGWADHEKITGLQIAGIVSVLSMVALVQYEPRAASLEPPADESLAA